MSGSPAKRSLISPGETAVRLNCSRSHVYFLCRTKTIESYLEKPGARHCRRLIVLASVERYLKEHGPVVSVAASGDVIPSKERGLLTARIFRAFDAGRTLRQIVVEYEVEPFWVRQLYRQWSQDLVHADVERATREQLREQTRVDRLNAQEAFRDHQKEMKRIEVEAQRRAAEGAARVLARSGK